ncbi:hypothetical protein [Ancylobacter aquaticus]|uniref:hypothetical protein n=1 Tax=Ancylobacter aquaticus TaxID=100 RepID=UPI001FE077B9|nr:hypothetical protein [Ancylobacter aquaticus]
MQAFDWSKVDALTDDQIIEAAKADPDSVMPTEAELAEFDLVLPAKARREMAQAKAPRAGDGDDDSDRNNPPKEAAE